MVTTIAPGQRPYIVFTSVLGPVGILWLAGYVTTWQVGCLYAGVLCFIIIACILLWISHYRIDLSGDMVIMGRFAGMKRSLHRNEIEEWYTVFGLLDRRGRVGSLARLVIEPTPSSGKGPLIIPVKFFVPEDIQALERFLPAEREACWE